MWDSGGKMETDDGAPRITPLHTLPIRANILSFVYFLHHLVVIAFTLFYMTLALGLCWAVLNLADAFISWPWWRKAGALLSLPEVVMMMYFLYVERKSVMQSQAMPGWMQLGRIWVNIYFYVYFAVLALLTTWVGLLMIWMSIADLGTCGSSSLCTGIEGASKASGAIIMIQVGGYGIMLCGIIAMLAALVIHGMAREIFQNNNQYTSGALAVGEQCTASPETLAIQGQFTNDRSAVVPLMHGKQARPTGHNSVRRGEYVVEV